MSRSIILLTSALIAALGLVLLFNVLATGVAARAPTSPPASRTLSTSAATCYAWDFLNNTGQDADTVHVRLKGVKTVSQVYTGTLNPFGAPDPSSGYDAVNDTYNLTFTNGLASDSDKVQLGACTDRADLRLGSPAPAFYWTISGTLAPPNPLFAGVSVSWLDPTHLHVGVYNEQNVTLTLMSLSVVNPDQPLQLDDLTHDIALLLPLAGEAVPDPVTLPPLGNQPYDVVVPRANAPYVVDATLAAEDDPGNELHVLAQSMAPPFLIYLPVVRK